MNKSACSVAATYKPPMLELRVQLPASALQFADAGDRVCFCRQMMKNLYIKDKTGE